MIGLLWNQVYKVLQTFNEMNDFLVKKNEMNDFVNLKTYPQMRGAWMFMFYILSVHACCEHVLPPKSIEFSTCSGSST